MDKPPARPNARGLGCTCMRLRKAARRVTQIYDHGLEAAGLTVTQYGVLGQLRRHDGIGIGALAEILIMDPTTLTRNLRPLERQGLVTMKQDRRDRRARHLHLTAKGSAAFENAIPAWRRAQRRLEEALGGPEAAALNAALDHVIARLAQ
ncbi:MAG: winged helix-turn-helix transcriptional regulator [Hyphomicrobiaceae bacterium]|nr:winged helix-turn-helix transcriptional regulator [Hyphomicrobiaceae bacterium]